MSNKFRVKSFFANQIMLSSIQEFEVEGIVFDIMALNAELKERVELCDSHNEMLAKAANFGLSFEGKRAIDNAGLDVSALWGEGELNIDSDPCIQYRVGEKICEISGLESALQEAIDTEAAARLVVDENEAYAEDLLKSGMIDGDSALPDVSIDRLNEDAAAAIV
jgi:hypothetical protein